MIATARDKVPNKSIKRLGHLQKILYYESFINAVLRDYFNINH